MEVSTSGGLSATEKKSRAGKLAETPKSLQFHRQTPGGGRDYEFLKIYQENYLGK